MANDDMLQWHGMPITGSDGEKIGKIDQIYVDNDNGQPQWASVNTGLFGTSTSFVPLAQASRQGEEIGIPYDKDMVKDAPRLDSDREITATEEQELYRYYGMTPGAPSTAPGGPPAADQHQVGHDTSGPTTDSAMTRSEEELRVGTQSVESGRARIRKHIVTEHVTETVPVRHEEVDVVREPITDANMGEAMDGPELSEEEHEVTLHDEVPVVDKRVVPKERVRLDTQTSTDEVRVEEDLRSEEIEVDLSEQEAGRSGRDQA